MVLDALGNVVRFPEAIPRALGLDLYKQFDADVGLANRLAETLDAHPDRDAEIEQRLLRDAAKVDAMRKQAPKARSKTSLRLMRPEGEVRVAAQEGRIDIRLPKKLSVMDRETLEAGVEALLSRLS